MEAKNTMRGQFSKRMWGTEGQGFCRGDMPQELAADSSSGFQRFGHKCGRGDRPVPPTAGQTPATVIPAQAGIQGRPTSVRPELLDERFEWLTTNEPSDDRTTLG